jgi:hypothetical protein
MTSHVPQAVGPSPQDPRLTEAIDFLSSFFSPPNEISLAEISPSGKAAHLLPWVERLLGGVLLPTVLPARQTGRVQWYGLAFSDSQLRGLGDQLLAFVGPTCSTFRGHRAVLDASDPVDAAVLQLTSGLAFKFSGPPDADKPKPVWDALELMRAVVRRRPDRLLDAPRATGRVLRDFYMALRAGNSESAAASLRYLSEQRRLTPSNVLFLRVQAHAELGEWEALLARPELSDLLQMRRPLAVTDALLRAVYHRELAHFEQDGATDGAVAHFRTVVLPTYGALFVRRTGMRAPEALKALMLVAVGGEPPDPVLRDSVWRTRGVSEEDRLYLKLLADRLPATPVQPAAATSMDAAIAARDRGDYEAAYALIAAIPASSARTRLLIECAYELQTLDSERNAVVAVAALTANERAAALHGRRLREMYESMGENAATASDVEASAPLEPVPENWIEWLERVSRDAAWAGALNVARRGAAEWTVDDLLALPSAVARMAGLLGDSMDNATVQNALPHVVAFFERDALWPRPELGRAYAMTLDLLALGSAGAEDDVRVYARLFDGVLELGVPKTIYNSFISGLRGLLIEAPSPGHILWGLEALEATVAHPCPDEDARLDLLLVVADLVRKYWRRVDSAQRSALRLLSEDLGHPDVFDSVVPSPPPGGVAQPAVSDVLAQLNGKLVGIYTLTERAGRYMMQILEDRAPQATVQLAHDKVASESLRQLARRADVFIMATASAKHAATEFIQANRASDRPLLRPGGKGMASMLHALEQFLSVETFDKALPLSS